MDGGRVQLPANLDIDHARLPANYATAKAALAQCSRVDECQDWADKMAALASYARQLNDEELLKFCRRIQARAIYRAGEVLQEIEPDKGGRPSKTQEGDLPSLTRTNAATEAGLSEHQRKTALRVSSVPAEQFESLVESDKPPTITVLAELGTKAKPPVIDNHLQGRDPADFQIATGLWGGVRDFAERMAKIDLEAARRGLSEREAAEVLQAVAAIHGWLDRVEIVIGGSHALQPA
jgi:hypothetical protein